MFKIWQNANVCSKIQLNDNVDYKFKIKNSRSKLRIWVNQQICDNPKGQTLA